MVSLFAVAVAAACATAPTPPTPDIDPGPTSEAEQYFTEQLVPVFEQSCSSCHANASDSYGAPDFLGGGATDKYYDTIAGWANFLQCDPTLSPLMTKGSDPTHPGASFATVDVPKVFQWLEIESERFAGEPCNAPDPTTSASTGGGSSGEGGGMGTGGGGTGGEGAGDPVGTPGFPPVSYMEHMQLFGACMTYDIWVNTGMPLVANQQATVQDNNTECYNCHSNPNTGLNHMPDPDNIEAVKDAFQNMREMFAVMNLVRWTVNPDGSVKELVPSWLWRDAGQSGSAHPPYTLQDQYVQTLQNWWDQQKLRYDESIAAGIPCDPAAGDPPP